MKNNKNEKLIDGKIIINPIEQKNLKEKFYDKIPIGVNALDKVITLLVATLVIVLIYAVIIK